MGRLIVASVSGPSDDLIWWKSSKSCEGACLEVARAADGGIFVRDSKDRSGPILHFNKSVWHAFVSDVRSGAFSPGGA